LGTFFSTLHPQEAMTMKWTYDPPAALPKKFGARVMGRETLFVTGARAEALAHIQQRNYERMKQILGRPKRAPVAL